MDDIWAGICCTLLFAKVDSKIELITTMLSLETDDDKRNSLQLILDELNSEKKKIAKQIEIEEEKKSKEARYNSTMSIYVSQLDYLEKIRNGWKVASVLISCLCILGYMPIALCSGISGATFWGYSLIFIIPVIFSIIMAIIKQKQIDAKESFIAKKSKEMKDKYGIEDQIFYKKNR